MILKHKKAQTYLSKEMYFLEQQLYKHIMGNPVLEEPKTLLRLLFAYDVRLLHSQFNLSYFQHKIH
jgi:hypothetical protein